MWRQGGINCLKQKNEFYISPYTCSLYLNIIKAFPYTSGNNCEKNNSVHKTINLFSNIYFQQTKNKFSLNKTNLIKIKGET